MNYQENHSPAALANWMPRGPGCMALAAGEGRWFTIDERSDGQHLMTLFSVCRWTALEAAERGLRHASLRERPPPAIAMGLHKETLVLTVKLGPGPLSQASCDASARALLRFLDVCVGP